MSAHEAGEMTAARGRELSVISDAEIVALLARAFGRMDDVSPGGALAKTRFAQDLFGRRFAEVLEALKRHDEPIIPMPNPARRDGRGA